MVSRSTAAWFVICSVKLRTLSFLMNCEFFPLKFWASWEHSMSWPPSQSQPLCVGAVPPFWKAKSWLFMKLLFLVVKQCNYEGKEPDALLHAFQKQQMLSWQLQPCTENSTKPVVREWIQICLFSNSTLTKQNISKELC